ncbi:hypothetical protein B0A55_12188 [Friedmanniomyces simplex]|nr:hypothetical protein B0A55_12188 [Friedmanniomyces simplex]
MSGSNSGTRKLTTNNDSSRNNHSGNAYDMSNVTASKLANKRYVSSVSAQDRLEREADARLQRARRERRASGDAADGESMASDSSQKIIIRRTVEQTSTQL